MYIIVLVIFVFFLISIKQINPGQTCLVFRLGKFSKLINKPGWSVVYPIFESMQKLDTTEDISEERLFELINVGVPQEVVYHQRDNVIV